MEQLIGMWEEDCYYSIFMRILESNQLERKVSVLSVFITVMFEIIHGSFETSRFRIKIKNVS